MRIRRAVPADAAEIWAIRTRAILHGCRAQHSLGGGHRIACAVMSKRLGDTPRTGR